jgi:YesN/AraC family two-component response regulator
MVGIFKKEYNIYTAGNGKKGLGTAIDKMPDLIVSDVMMPEMDGFELCNRVKTDERTSHIPVILLTAKSGEENKITGLEQGADDYIVKPFSAKELQARVKNSIIQRQKLREKFGKELDTIEPESIAVSPMDRTFLKKAMAIVEQNMHDPEFGPGLLVRGLGMSRSLVHNKLKSLTGQSASRFIESMRLRVAARLLKENNRSISEIAYEVGFNDNTYFTRQFKKAFKKTPTEYCSS